MRHLRPLLLSALLGVAAFSSGASASTIRLRDGSLISGEVLTLSGGVYSIRSETLGTVTIRQADVEAISEGAAPVPAAPAGAGHSAASVQQRLASDPALMRDVSALQDNPDVQSILNDPEIMNALRSGNLEVLVGNPKLGRLAADPRVQALVGKLAE